MIGNFPSLCYLSILSPGKSSTEPLADCREGDGKSREEQFLEKTDSMDECVKLVKSSNPGANGATWGIDNNKCYSEVDMTGWSQDSGVWESCKFESRMLLFARWGGRCGNKRIS